MIRLVSSLTKLIISNRRWHARLCNFMKLMQSHRYTVDFLISLLSIVAWRCLLMLLLSLRYLLWTKVSDCRFYSMHAGYDMSPFIRRYAKYLNEKALSYRTVAFDFCKVKRGCVSKQIFSKHLKISLYLLSTIA